eukprot:8959200-Pyramimonas_sp.AAC.1
METYPVHNPLEKSTFFDIAAADRIKILWLLVEWKLQEHPLVRQVRAASPAYPPGVPACVEPVGQRAIWRGIEGVCTPF